MNIFNNIRHYARPTSIGVKYASSQDKDFDGGNKKTSKLKERFKTFLGCFGCLTIIAIVVLLCTVTDGKILLCIGGVMFICAVGPQLLTLFALPFLMASDFTNKKWKIIVLGLIIILLVYGAMYLKEIYFGEGVNPELLDSSRPDRW